MWYLYAYICLFMLSYYFRILIITISTVIGVIIFSWGYLPKFYTFSRKRSVYGLWLRWWWYSFANYIIFISDFLMYLLSLTSRLCRPCSKPYVHWLCILIIPITFELPRYACWENMFAALLFVFWDTFLLEFIQFIAKSNLRSFPFISALLKFQIFLHVEI